jgi:hypothetical protein
MLVSINTNPASESTDNKSRFFNFMASLYAVATCAAAGTPTAVRPVKTSDGTKNTNFNCITVISNTEAGGWTAGVSNNITPATAYSATSASLIVDLYNATGKATYPYYRQTFGNISYSFSGGSYETYPQLEYFQGCTSSDPSSVVYTSSGSYADQGAAFRRGTSQWTSYPDSFMVDVTRSTNTTVYVAVTANYLIITTDHSMAYFGIRDQSGWELTRNDNPPWVVFGFCGRADNVNFVNNNTVHCDYYHAWASRITPIGTQSSPSKLGQHRQNDVGTTPHAITGVRYGSSDIGSYWGLSSATGNMRPLFSLAYPAAGGTTGYGWAMDPPTTDSVTGLSVPPAYPLVFQYSNGGSEAVSGRMPGCYRGMASTLAGLNYTVTATEYTIGGEAYTPIRTGNPTYPDLFFLRKA